MPLEDLLLTRVIGLLVCVWAQLCSTLCDPMDCSPPGSSVHGILQARILEWAAISSSRGSSQPMDQTLSSCICRQILLGFKENHSCSGFDALRRKDLFLHFFQPLFTECSACLQIYYKYFLSVNSEFGLGKRDVSQLLHQVCKFLRDKQANCLASRGHCSFSTITTPQRLFQLRAWSAGSPSLPSHPVGSQDPSFIMSKMRQLCFRHWHSSATFPTSSMKHLLQSRPQLGIQKLRHLKTQRSFEAWSGSKMHTNITQLRKVS